MNVANSLRRKTFYGLAKSVFEDIKYKKSGFSFFEEFLLVILPIIQFHVISRLKKKRRNGLHFI
ncbi:MAG TPA: hypothetical protein VF610_00855, partial [Segetibacter sp.]